MKINYTLPGYAPETDVGKELTDSFDSPFKNRLQAFERRQPVAWRDLLGLNRVPPDPSQLAAPETPLSQANDAASFRQDWRNLLSRHAASADAPETDPAVRRMLALLDSYRKESDRMFSRGLAEGQF